jgi:probable phosphoglycerate mutase
LPRAHKTAEIIGKHIGLNPIPDPRLREIDYGNITGYTLSEFERDHPGEYRIFRSSMPEEPIPGGESLRRRYKLNAEMLREVSDRHAGESVLMVVHGGVLDNVFRYITGIPLQTPKMWSVLNASVSTILRMGDRWIIESWGCIAHQESHPLDGDIDYTEEGRRK